MIDISIKNNLSFTHAPKYLALAEEYKKDYKFYLRCRRVLYKRGASKKLIAKVNREIEFSKKTYESYMTKAGRV